MAKHGLFIGMVTLDLIYLSPKLPGNNEKIAASDYTISAGGPATNAAVTFSYLNNQATLLGVIGTHPITQLIQGDLQKQRVTIADLAPTKKEPPPVSSIIITQGTGDRAVISLHGDKITANSDQIPITVNNGIDLVMIDGHQMAVSIAIAKLAQTNHIPVIIDGGSWKPGFENILPCVNYAICSANFHPPGCTNSPAVIEYLATAGIPYIAITHGEKPIQYYNRGQLGELPVPQIHPIDTLGAGDIFHGAFCHYILQQNFTNALTASAKIAAYSCQFFGTRQWMETDQGTGNRE